MKPLGARRRLRASAERELQDRQREILAGFLKEREALEASAREAERSIRFADSSWAQVERIAATRGITNRHAVAEAIAVWEVVSQLVKAQDGPVEFRVRGQSAVMVVRRGSA